VLKPCGGQRRKASTAEEDSTGLGESEFVVFYDFGIITTTPTF